MNGALDQGLPLGASVIVCCHNARARIAATLEHLARQRVDVPWEVVLVANACDDATADVARSTWSASGAPAPLAVVDEPRLGLTPAREAGVRNAQYRYLVFCDDDNWLAPDYLERAVRLFETDARIGVLGGSSTAQADAPLPAWFAASADDYGVGPQGDATGDVTPRGYLWGAGMCVRAGFYRALLQAGVTGLLADRQGRRLSCGGDVEICRWYVIAGYRLWYDEALRLEHFIPAERLTPEYCRRLNEGFRDSWDVLGRYHVVEQALAMRSAPRRLLRFASGLGRMALLRPNARWIVQAFHPWPALVADGMTRRVQMNVAAILRREHSTDPLSQC